ncbi:hypothetical protein BZA05DRAFT_415924 [Tricharina praecox]|uniref:uncharacterized protein n=1 Tax=Tricharina praecox TaxID=43433 RepID=UPI00221F9DFA|nr:uncharacterized protein BZA05DRAFT_415924 [Tricharina praecox]KAI5857256.1 hypothetical protein BZA05DRAFT_415924 [Tricharina praecox]
MGDVLFLRRKRGESIPKYTRHTLELVESCKGISVRKIDKQDRGGNPVSDYDTDAIEIGDDSWCEIFKYEVRGRPMYQNQPNQLYYRGYKNQNQQGYENQNQDQVAVTFPRRPHRSSEYPMSNMRQIPTLESTEVEPQKIRYLHRHPTSLTMLLSERRFLYYINTYYALECYYYCDTCEEVNVSQEDFYDLGNPEKAPVARRRMQSD